jgi:hypothetical protein
MNKSGGKTTSGPCSAAIRSGRFTPCVFRCGGSFLCWGQILIFDISRVERPPIDTGPSPIPRPIDRKPASPRPRHPQNTSPPNTPSSAPSAPSANSSPPKAPASSDAGDEMATAAHFAHLSAYFSPFPPPRMWRWPQLYLTRIGFVGFRSLRHFKLRLSFASLRPERTRPRSHRSRRRADLRRRIRVPRISRSWRSAIAFFPR